MTKQQSSRQRGFSLWEMLILLSLIAGLAVVTTRFLLEQPAELAEVSLGTLQRADQALLGFAASNHRLPCPDTNGDGFENCGSAEKGALPYRTLGFYGALIGPDAPRLQYMVYRDTSNGGLADLASAEAVRFRPVNWEGEAYDFNAINGLDFCVGVAAAADLPNMARASIGSRNVAYGLAAPGRHDADGSGSLFDGANALGAASMESPWRQRDASYDDVVISRSFGSLINELNCASAISSIQTTALAIDSVEEILDQAEGLKESAIIAVVMNSVQTVIAGISLVMAIKAVAAAIVTLSAAITGLAGAIASCIVLVGCAFIPTFTAAVVAGAIGVALSAVAAGLTAGGLAASIAATVLSGMALARTGAEVSDADFPDDWAELDGFDIGDSADAEEGILEAIESARQLEAEALDELNDANAKLTAAQQRRDDIEGRLRQCAIDADKADDDDEEDGTEAQERLETAFNAARARNEQELEVADQESEVEQATALVFEYEQAEQQLLERLGENLSDAERTSVQNQLAEVREDLEEQRERRAQAQIDLNQARSDYDARLSEFQAARNDFNAVASCGFDSTVFPPRLFEPGLWQEADREVTLRQTAVREAEENLVAAREARENLEEALGVIRGTPGGDSGSNPGSSSFWASPLDVLRAMNARGVSP